MKELVKYSRVCGQLEKIYRQLNADFFAGQLEEPVITIMSTRNAYGHVTCARVWKTKETSRFELNIGAGTLARPIENVVATMLHEMVHIFHLMNGIKDVSRGGAYHNKRFKQKAEEVGLIITYDSRIGWSVTQPSDDLVLYICEKGWNEILMNRNEGYSLGVGVAGTGDKEYPAIPPKPPKKPSSTRKYVCPECGQSVRATRDTHIICGYCNKRMEKEG